MTYCGPKTASYLRDSVIQQTHTAWAEAFTPTLSLPLLKDVFFPASFWLLRGRHGATEESCRQYIAIFSPYRNRTRLPRWRYEGLVYGIRSVRSHRSLESACAHQHSHSFLAQFCGFGCVIHQRRGFLLLTLKQILEFFWCLSR